MSLLGIGWRVRIHLCRGQARPCVCAWAVVRIGRDICREGVAAANWPITGAGRGHWNRHIKRGLVRAAGRVCSALRDIGTRGDCQALVVGSGKCHASGDGDGGVQNCRLLRVRVGR